MLCVHHHHPPPSTTSPPLEHLEIDQRQGVGTSLIEESDVKDCLVGSTVQYSTVHTGYSSGVARLRPTTGGIKKFLVSFVK
jgi:hypothetical protein